MQLTCPECGEKITPENINIQQMAAVCSDCGTVFQFDVPEAKIKHRKMKPPQDVMVTDSDEQLHLAYRTNFRLGKNEMFLVSIILSITSTALTLNMLEKFIAGELGALIVVSFGLIAAFFYYNLALIAYNKTHITMDDEAITVSRRPLPGLFEQSNEISLAGVVGFQYEETPISKEKGYDTPRYRVWAETEDGRRKLIVTDLIEDYALYLTQKLNVQLENDRDVSRLVDEVNMEPTLEEERTENHKSHLSSS